jgi:hypothetical protein
MVWMVLHVIQSHRLCSTMAVVRALDAGGNHNNDHRMSMQGSLRLDVRPHILGVTITAVP